MLPVTENTKVRPFHETVVEAICHSQSPGEVVRLFQLLQNTRILEGHNEILAAARERVGKLENSWKWNDEMAALEKSLLAQRQAATNRNALLSHIKSEIGKLVERLGGDRQSNLREMVTLRALLSRALGEE